MAFEQISTALDIAVAEKKDKPLKKIEDKLDENFAKDYDTVRQNVLNLMETMADVIDESSTEIKAAPSARFLESFSLLAKTYFDINKDFLNLSKKDKVDDEKEKEDGTTVNAVIFNGTSNSLLDTIKKNLK